MEDPKLIYRSADNAADGAARIAGFQESGRDDDLAAGLRDARATGRTYYVLREERVAVLRTEELRLENVGGSGTSPLAPNLTAATRRKTYDCQVAAESVRPYVRAVLPRCAEESVYAFTECPVTTTVSPLDGAH